MSRGRLTPRDARIYAAGVVESLLGAEPDTIRRRGGGLTNYVFQVDIASRSFVVRVNPDPHQLRGFERGRRAMTLARAADIPVPTVIDVGAAPHPFMVLERVEGTMASEWPDRASIIQQMGELTARIHRIHLHGFGPSALDTDSGKRISWRAHLIRDVDAAQRLRTLDRHNMLSSHAARAMNRSLTHLASWRRSAVLHHGDMRLKNLLVGADGKVRAVLDWETCLASVAGLWDLSIALHDLSIDEKEVFLQAYGYRPRDLRKLMPFIRLLNALNYAPVVEGLAERGDTIRLEWHRARLAGHLDLYH